jgi:hypothetical protein
MADRPEPLDDTLADVDPRYAELRDYAVDYAGQPDADALAHLLADHARLTAALDRICWDIEGDDHVEIARAALSAEAGDKVPNAGPWPPTHWPALSAEAGDGDA